MEVIQFIAIKIYKIIKKYIQLVNKRRKYIIIPKYRRLKIGKSVAIELFNMHNGIWEVKPSYGNKGAFSFWKNVIDEYTNNDNKFEDGLFIIISK